MKAQVFICLAGALACRRSQPLLATADDASIRDVAVDTAVVDVADAETDIDMTAHATVTVVVYEPDPREPLTTLPGGWAPGRYREKLRWKLEPYLGEPVRLRLPDGSFFEFNVNRMMNAASWTGTKWVHDTVIMSFKKSGSTSNCLGARNPYKETVGAYTVVAICDSSSVPAIAATSPFAGLPPPGVLVDALPPG